MMRLVFSAFPTEDSIAFNRTRAYVQMLQPLRGCGEMKIVISTHFLAIPTSCGVLQSIQMYYSAVDVRLIEFYVAIISASGNPFAN